MARKLALLMLALLAAVLLWPRLTSEPVPLPLAAPDAPVMPEKRIDVEVPELIPQPARAEVHPDPEPDASAPDTLSDPGSLTPATLCVRIVASDTHAPCAEAWVGDAGAPDACDREGRIELRLTLHDTLQAGATGFMPQVFTATAGHETPETALEVELQRAASLLVVLEDAPRTGFPSLSVTREFDVHAYMPSGQGFFDEEGRARLDELPPDVPLHVRVSDGRSKLVELSDPVSLRAGELRELRVSLGETCRVVGRALDERGVPVAGLELWILPSAGELRTFVDAGQRSQAIARAHTDEQGRFVFEGVLPGAWRLSPAVNSREIGLFIGREEIAPVALPLEIRAGAREISVEYLVRRGYSIAGLVLDAQGAPAGSVQVIARGAQGAATGSSRADGHFELGPLPADGYELVAAEWSPLASKAVRAEAGARDVVLRLQRLGRIAGRVVDATTREPVAAQVTLLQTHGDAEFDPTRFCEPDGSFEFDGLPTGSYALCATPYDGRFALLRGIEIAAGGEASGLVLELARGARLKLRGVGIVRVEQAGLRLGAYRLDVDEAQEVSVPAGSVRLVLRTSAGREQVRELALEAGELREVRFEAQD